MIKTDCVGSIVMNPPQMWYKPTTDEIVELVSWKVYQIVCDNFPDPMFAFSNLQIEDD